MAIREILKMGDPRLLRVAQPVLNFGGPELTALVADMKDTMPAANGAGLAAPQIGVDLQLVIFGFERNQRYPDAEPVPYTVLCNPRIEPLGPEEEDGWEGCLSVPGLRGAEKLTDVDRGRLMSDLERRSKNALGPFDCSERCCCLL